MSHPIIIVRFEEWYKLEEARCLTLRRKLGLKDAVKLGFSGGYDAHKNYMGYIESMPTGVSEKSDLIAGSGPFAGVKASGLENYIQDQVSPRITPRFIWLQERRDELRKGLVNFKDTPTTNFPGSQIAAWGLELAQIIEELR